jgi:hypothetical protein
MKVWVITFTDTTFSEHAVSVWDNKLAAELETCSYIVDEINAHWDLNDAELVKLAQEIETYIVASQFDNAITLWNEISNDRGLGLFYTVEGDQVYISNDATIPTSINFKQPAIKPDEPSQPLTLTPEYGAVCKICKQENEYQIKDVNYVCRQCSTFKSIFAS